ncbi:hypothetical protein L6164_023105 [Bauhinia variegata]|uniref:Uncharacterized protein n=1 Tax=Bauhinia variegata TaxID=167791 RepID=A0ACB9MIR0_BAUVA|nr:hypothetical protein L6164_023105 [Bauhinia variegata]
MNRSVKVAVIEADILGLFAARELQREGHRVVVFEKQRRIGGTFPGHEEELRFLNKFADEFGLRSLTQLNTGVVRVERVNKHWVVESRTQSSASVSQEREVFVAVVICTGHFTELIIVKIPSED